jgi:hypothetical protein
VGAHIAELVRTTLMAPDDVAVTGQQLTCRCRVPASCDGRCRTTR